MLDASALRSTERNRSGEFRALSNLLDVLAFGFEEIVAKARLGICGGGCFPGRWLCAEVSREVVTRKLLFQSPHSGFCGQTSRVQDPCFPSVRSTAAGLLRTLQVLHLPGKAHPHHTVQWFP